MLRWVLLCWLVLGGCAGEEPGGDAAESGGTGAGAGAGAAAGAKAGAGLGYGARYEGGEFHLGPVDWEESQWHNACAPAGKYAPAIRQLEGTLLAGLWNGLPNVSSFAKCPDTGQVMYEFQTGSSEWWTSFWVRNARVPLSKVEVKSQKHDYTVLTRGGDGTLTDAGGFGKGPFSIRLTGADGAQLVHDFQWPSAGIAGQMLTAQGNFD